MAKQVSAVKDVCPWITRDSIMNFHRKRCKETRLLSLAQEESRNGIVALSTRADECAIAPYTPMKQNGRPKGTTNKRKHLEELALVSTKNEISLRYEEERRAHKRLNK